MPYFYNDNNPRRTGPTPTRVELLSNYHFHDDRAEDLLDDLRE
jgi:hypothetical protein